MVDLQGDNLFQELGEFALCVLSLPQSSAKCEKQFCKTNLVKTKSCNRSQFVTSFDKSCISFAPSDILKDVFQSLRF